MNIVVPLQIGARDVAFPFVNSLSFWLTVAGAMLINVSLVAGRVRRTGWLAYPPLSELAVQPGRGRRLLHLGLQISGVGTLLTGDQLLRDHRQDARARHDADEDAGVHVDGAVHERADHRRRSRS